MLIKKNKLSFVFLFLLLIIDLNLPLALSENEINVKPWEQGDEQRYANILNWVYETMDKEYFNQISEETYRNFLSEFPAHKMFQINTKNRKTEDFIHLGAGLLANKLKVSGDRFSTLVPPSKVEAFKEKAYAETKDLGITGKMESSGYRIHYVQKHSEAFEKGARPGQLILEINGEKTAGKTTEEVDIILNPEIGTKIELAISGDDELLLIISLESQPYFIETVEQLKTERPDILALKISQFNQKTSEDFGDMLQDFGIRNINHLILDLRGNQGGPPLAAKEMMGYLSPPKDPLFLIVRKNRKPFLLSSDSTPNRYEGPISILTDNLTASAAETLTGVLREKGRAIVYGQKTNGASYLKSVYDYEDGSSLVLVTSRTFFHNLKVFPPEGLVPDVIIPESADSYLQVLATV